MPRAKKVTGKTVKKVAKPAKINKAKVGIEVSAALIKSQDTLKKLQGNMKELRVIKAAANTKLTKAKKEASGSASKVKKKAVLAASAQLAKSNDRIRVLKEKIIKAQTELRVSEQKEKIIQATAKLKESVSKYAMTLETNSANELAKAISAFEAKWKIKRTKQDALKVKAKEKKETAKLKKISKSVEARIKKLASPAKPKKAIRKKG